MDFWSRLIGGVGSQERQLLSNNPQQRLTRFKRTYSQILQTWQKTSSLPQNGAALETLKTCFERLTSILHDESRSPAPHPCLSFASTASVFFPVARIAATAYNEGIAREAVALFAALIDSEEEDFLADSSFAKALMTLVERLTGPGNTFAGLDVEGEVVELLFGIAAKIRLQAEILPAWFTPGIKAGSGDASTIGESTFAGFTKREDFPLCYQLVDHVHHEGRIGDFARTGLLYIFEAASASEELEVWLVESDLPTLMASGLGALYSQMSRKLSTQHPEANMPAILALSDYSTYQLKPGVESSFSGAFLGHMETFLSYLNFWQDVLEHCKSLDVMQTLVDHFQVLFLQQILYPSLLESSDVDGGSSVAVLTYIRYVLDSLDRPELVTMILDYLLALSGPADNRRSRPRSPLIARRRSSLMLLTQSENEDERPNPSIFNLVDLMISSARSQDSETVVAAFKLLTVLVSKNHGYAVDTILRVVHHSPTKVLKRTLGSLAVETEIYLSFAASFGGEAGLDEAYESHLKDMQRLIEAHKCSMQGRDSLESETPRLLSSLESLVGSVSRHVDYHFLSTHDSLLRSLFAMCERFFTNEVEINLALTEVFVTLASCSRVHLEGWLVVDPAKYTFTSRTDGEEPGREELVDLTASQSLQFTEDGSQTRDPVSVRRRPAWAPGHEPALLSILNRLQAQWLAMTKHLPTLASLAASRRRVLQTHDAISTEAEMLGSVASPTKVPTRSSRLSSPAAGLATPPGNTSIGDAVPRRNLADFFRSDSRSSSPLPKAQVTTTSPPAASPSRGRSRNLSPVSDTGRMPDLTPTVKGLNDRGDELSDSISMNAETLSQRIRFFADGSISVGGLTRQYDQRFDDVPERDPTQRADAGEFGKEVSLNHVLTNAIILQEFILEIVALIQLRASLFGEVLLA